MSETSIHVYQDTHHISGDRNFTLLIQIITFWNMTPCSKTEVYLSRSAAFVVCEAPCSCESQYTPTRINGVKTQKTAVFLATIVKTMIKKMAPCLRNVCTNPQLLSVKRPEF